jgi:predicted extracellular nuclease
MTCRPVIPRLFATAILSMLMVSSAVADPVVLDHKIHEIQGSGSSVAITTEVRVEAVVTSRFEDNDLVEGFFIQEEDFDVDADPATSEGIFVYCENNCPVLALGDLVQVVGTAAEFFDMSQIDASNGSVLVIGNGMSGSVSATFVNLPAAGSTTDSSTFEALEGMKVTFPQTLFVSEYFQLARFGQITLTQGGRPEQFTHANLPSVAGYQAYLDDLARQRIFLDDNNNDSNDAISNGPDEAYPYPQGGLSSANYLRGGDTIDGLTGVLHWSFAGSGSIDAWRIRPSAEAIEFEAAIPRPATPAEVGGSLKVASFNLLNYFTTLDEPGIICGPSSQRCRGADSARELERQKAKIVAALAAMDADIVGLVELENNAQASLDGLTTALNAAGAGPYSAIQTGTIGLDAIKVGIIYKPDTVSPTGDFGILDSSVDITFNDMRNRPVLAQSFTESASGSVFTVAVNHLKSKGAPCDDLGDPNNADGQANCNGTRTAATTALANWLASDPTASGDPDFLILGDLNAYAKEDPIAALESAGYTNLIESLPATEAYSFVFDGQLGYLDHALASQSLLEQITGVTLWHINVDEVPLLDYNDEIQDAAEASFERESAAENLFTPDAYRSSDHDPVIVGLGFRSIPGTRKECKKGGWKNLYRADGSSFKNQGKCVRYVNTGK